MLEEQIERKSASRTDSSNGEIDNEPFGKSSSQRYKKFIETKQG